jgi:hypothetical protein
MIAYVTNAYFGYRSSSEWHDEYIKDPFFYTRSLLKRFSEIKSDLVSKIIIVISPSSEEKDLAGIEMIREMSRIVKDKEIYFFLRENNFGYSYGAIEEGMNKFCGDKDLEYFFLAEDDYIPAKDNFYLPFLSKYYKKRNKITYVCSLISHYVQAHPGIYGVLLSTENVRKVKKMNSGYCLTVRNELSSDQHSYDYEIGVWNQIHSLDAYTVYLGMPGEDLYEEYCHPYLRYCKSHVLKNGGGIFYLEKYGKLNGEILLEPVL